MDRSKGVETQVGQAIKVCARDTVLHDVVGMWR